jgi:preprotein translocase subunit SecA
MTNTKINPTIYPRKGSPPLKSPPQTLASPLPTLCSPLFSSTSQDTLFQYAEDAAVKSLSSVVSEINAIEAKVEEMDDDALSQLTQTLKSKPNTPLSFAAVREASWRVLTQRHYDCQLVGGLLMDGNKLCEMQTGEGKTLTTLLPVYNKVVNGKRCFIVTTNDYLARRDSLVNGQVLNFLGVSTGLIQGGMTEDERRRQYDNDVVWVR